MVVCACDVCTATNPCCLTVCSLCNPSFFQIGKGTLRLSFTYKYENSNNAEAEQVARAKLLAFQKQKEFRDHLNIFKSSAASQIDKGMGSALGSFVWHNYQLRVHLYQARHLTPTDDNGLSDPYVVVMYGGVK